MKNKITFLLICLMAFANTSFSQVLNLKNQAEIIDEVLDDRINHLATYDCISASGRS